MCDFDTTTAVIEKYKIIQKQFKSQCKREGIEFDEDIYNDSMLKCFEKLAPKGIDDINNAKDYLWNAFKMNTFRERKYHRNCKRCDFELDCYSILDEEYNTSIDEKYNIVIREIKLKYGEKWCEMFQQHTEKGVTYKDLEKIYGESISTIKNTFRCIRNHIRKKYKDIWM